MVETSRPDASAVTILLCTFNGARHLEAQLQSIAGQSLPDWRLWVSDDGSTDGTWKILESFRKVHHNHDIRLMRGAGRGAAANYLSLMLHPDLPRGPVAFCDQDDVWLPGKLERAVTRLAQFNASPAAYAASSIVTDNDLHEIGRLDASLKQPSFVNALVQNILHGGTLVLNEAALTLLRRGERPDVSYHDWWCYVALTGCGARIVMDDAMALKYRQHGQNHIGYNGMPGAGRRRYRLITDGSYRHWMVQNARAVLEADLPLTPLARETAEAFLKLQTRSGPQRMLGYSALNLKRQSRRATLVLKAMACAGYA